MERNRDGAGAASLVGERVRLETTYADAGGQAIRQARFGGRFVSAYLTGGIDLGLDAGDGFRLPPDLSTFEGAHPGGCLDDSTGGLVEVEDRDVRAMWHIPVLGRPLQALRMRFGRREGEGHAA